jgi:hypothetical protein
MERNGHSDAVRAVSVMTASIEVRDGPDGSEEKNEDENDGSLTERLACRATPLVAGLRPRRQLVQLGSE